MNIGICIEVVINLVQQLLIIGFLYLFFEKDENRMKNALAFSVVVFTLFTMANYFTFRGLTFNHLDSLITIAIMLLYSLLFLKGDLYLRILMPIIALGINILVAYLNLGIMVYFSSMSFVEALTFSTSFRYLYIITTNLIYAVALLVLLRIGKKKIQVSSIPEIISFLLIAVIIYVAALSDMILYEVSDFNEKILPYVVIICVSIFALTGIFWYLLLKVSKDSKLKTDLLLSKQREEMYKTSVLSTNEQIEKLSKVKHDMKNHTMTISSLISNGEYERAQKLCESVSDKLDVVSLSHSGNPVLNAILNVEKEKASDYDIVFNCTVSDELSFVEDADIVSIIGNLCDNAIEYLSGVEKDQRNLSLNISMYIDYYYITCKNTIMCSILSDNPQMNTTKKDVSLHGKGIRILRDIAEKYDGEVLIKEYEEELSVSVIIRYEN